MKYQHLIYILIMISVYQTISAIGRHRVYSEKLKRIEWRLKAYKTYMDKVKEIKPHPKSDSTSFFYISFDNAW